MFAKIVEAAVLDYTYSFQKIKKRKKKKKREEKKVGYAGRGFFVEFGSSRASSLAFCKLFHSPSNIIRSRNLYTHRSPMILHTRASGATIPVE